MHQLRIVNLAASVPMGAQVYEDAVSDRAGAALGQEWQVRRMVVRSLRSRQQGTHRIPLGSVSSASPATRRALGRLLYPRRAVVHRMNLELPPSSHADVVTLHDVVSWRYPDETPPVPAAMDELRRAAAVICVSEFTASEAVELLGVRDPHVVHNGVDGRFFDAVPLATTDLEQLGVEPPFVLAGGGASRRKNLAALAEAWPLVHDARPDLSLVLSGPEHPTRTRLFRDLPDVHLVGRAPSEVMPGLMAAASAVVIPSEYEGFGLPALEAMAAGVPVVAASTSALPEVVGDGGILVEPRPGELAEGLLFATSDDTEVARVVARGHARAASFTWERSAAGHAEVWRSVAGA